MWCAPGRNSATLQGFFDELGDRKDSIRAVSIDMSGEYQRAIRDGRPATPRSALTPSTSSGSPPAPPTRSAATNGTATTARTRPTGRWVKGTRWSLLKAPEHQTIGQLATLAEVQRDNRRLYRAFLLREELRLLYHLPDPALAPDAPRRLAGLGHRAPG